jgi:hypothetical protein
MKKLLFLFLLFPHLLFASFYAYNLTYPGHSWYNFEMKQLDFEVEVYGLFYETTITYQIKLAPTNWGSPYPGTYEINWDFDLVEDAVVTDCWIKSPSGQEFVPAQLVDLTSAEDQYEISPNAQSRLLLRHRYQRQWDGTLMKRFQMKFSPVTISQTPVIKIRYLAPCRPHYNSRRLTLPVHEFQTYKKSSANVYIHDNEHSAQKPFHINNAGSSWQNVNDRWKSTLYQYDYNQTLIGIVPESEYRQYLQTYSNGTDQFYQLAISPPITKADLKPKNILIASDITSESHIAKSLYQQFLQAVLLSSSNLDSVAMVYSQFVPTLYDSLFLPADKNRVNAMFNKLLAQPVPTLNTLPHLLKQAVGLFNSQNKSGEIWLLTDANAHSDPPATAMEIISQTLGQAKNPLKFRIISADKQYWPYQYINSQYYYGNDYLYDNLARLSWGTYEALRFRETFDYLDAMLDVLAPTASSVEIDANPSGGLAYSQFQLNRGRANFPHTLPYYEIGLYGGSAPFNTHFYGFVNGDLFARDVEKQPSTNDNWNAVQTYWYDSYVQNLLLEPQSYETIRYIEEVSMEYSLLTPYSGFIVPGPQGKLAFQRLTEAIPTDVTDEGLEKENLPAEYEMSAYPNPFNAFTRITFQLPLSYLSEQIEIQIYNYLGQIVLRKEIPSAGFDSTIEFLWDGTDDYAQSVPSGLYFVTIRAGDILKNLKITLVK